MKQRFKFIPAVYLVLERDNKILLSRRFNTGYEDGKYSLVAGHLDGDETLQVALAREAKEEVGISINPKDLQLVHVMHARSEIADSTEDERVDFYFSTSSFEGEPTILEEDKCDELRWCPLEDLPEDIIEKVRVALTCIADGELYSDFGW